MQRLPTEARRCQPRASSRADNAPNRLLLLPAQVYCTETELESLPQHELIERCKHVGVETAGCLEKHDLVERLKQAGGTTGEGCAICSDDYASGDVLRVLPCRGKHRYHLACIDRWARAACDQGRSPTCPICNTSLVDNPEDPRTGGYPRSTPQHAHQN